jgi:hypothetical protein
MHTLVFHEVDVVGVLFAGLAAGYVMAMAGLWAGQVPWLTSIDIADFGRRYMVSDRPTAWLVGMGSHLANSVLLTYAWVVAIQPNMPWSGPLGGLVWGIVLALTFAGALVSPLAGLGFLGLRIGGRRYAATSIVMHVLWGLLVGTLTAP